MQAKMTVKYIRASLGYDGFAFLEVHSDLTVLLHYQKKTTDLIISQYLGV
jgi:hypothetical protein